MGGVSRFYVAGARALPDMRLVAVCDRDPEHAADFAGSGGVATYHDASALLTDAAVEAVVIDTPVPTHVDLVRAALEAGRHVCCEKPLALTRSDAHALAALARARGLALFTAFHRRYNRNLPARGSLPLEGLESVEVRYLERIEEHASDLGWYLAPATNGGGCIVDNGPNALDVVRHLFGDPSVDAVDVGRSPAGVDVRAEIRGRVPGGASATIALAWDYDGECKDLRVRWRDGRELHADMLEGFPAFKSSLEHEYVGVLREFAEHVASGAADPAGQAATAWLEDVIARSR